jgi:hypothetical protein
MLDSPKKWFAVLFLTIIYVQGFCANSSSESVIIIGGRDYSGSQPPYAALVTPSGSVQPLSLPLTNAYISSVAINGSGVSIIGGRDNTGTQPPYAALVTPSGSVQPLPLSITNGAIASVAINGSGAAIIGGRNYAGVQPSYAALVTPGGTVQSLSLPVTAGNISSVAINGSDIAVVGGWWDNAGTQAPYAARVTPSGSVQPLSLSITNGNISSVAINGLGVSIIGGWWDNAGVQPPYAALVTPSGSVQSLSLPLTDGYISSVAINESGTAIIGGWDNTGTAPPYAALVTPSGSVQPLPLSITNGYIFSVAINGSGTSIIGGWDRTGTQPPYAALVTPSGSVQPLSLPITYGTISSVTINDSGAAVIGGRDYAGTRPPYAALVSPSGGVTSLPLSLTNAHISSVAIESISMMVDPKFFGPGNTYADSLFTLSTVVLENHLKRPTEEQTFTETANLTADAQDIIRPNPSCQDTPKYVLWASPFGLYAHHKKEEKTFPDLRDRSVGGIIGFDYLGWEGFVLGGGGAYAYQNIGYSDHFGKARVNQEFLTLYGAWYQKHIAIQGALWGGLYQMHNTRKTLGFIQSTSHVNGWLFSPHIEVSTPFPFKNKPVTIEPFVMFDWVNNWQDSVKEKGKSGLNLRINDHHVSLLRSEIGLHLLESFQIKGGDLTFEESFSYVNKLPFSTKEVSTYYVGSISTFNLQMFSNRTVNLGAVGLSAKFTPCSLKPPYVYLTYQGEFGSKLLTHTFALEIGKRF